MSEITVEFICSISEHDAEVALLSKRGNDNDLLVSHYLTYDCGLIIPDGFTPGIYKCTNLRIVNQYISGNPDCPEDNYDLECDWLKILDYVDVFNSKVSMEQELGSALEGLLSNDLWSIDDLVYTVKDCASDKDDGYEGDSWEHPDVLAFNAALNDAYKVLRKFQNKKG